jgi:hypothetical protein
VFGSATPAVAAKTFRDMIYSTTRQQFDESKAFTCMATLPQFHAARWSFRTLVDHPSGRRCDPSPALMLGFLYADLKEAPTLRTQTHTSGPRRSGTASPPLSDEAR